MITANNTKEVLPFDQTDVVVRQTTHHWSKTKTLYRSKSGTSNSGMFCLTIEKNQGLTILRGQISSLICYGATMPPVNHLSKLKCKLLDSH